MELTISDATGRPRHLHLVGLLTFASGCVDAVTLMAIGGAFTSVITGNLIFTGRAIGTTALTPAVHAILAVAGYIAGVAAGARLAHLTGRSAPKSAWPQRATIVLAVECILLIAVNLAWIAYRADPPAVATDILLVALALCLGMQGASARTIDGTPSTTYMTGALTTLVEAVCTGRGRQADRSAAIGLAALVVGAAVGAVLIVHAPRTALLPPLAAVIVVVTIKARHHRAERAAA
jgi:uncharacterized membrane protein YoaK (UPF0700 family)